MNLKSAFNDSNKQMLNNNYPIPRSSLQINDRRDSTTSSSRTMSPVAFFHDSVTTSEIDLRFNIMDAQRRARAIATAPRRNRYDDDDDDDDEEDIDQKKTLSGFVKTPAVPIPMPSVTQQTQSLPQTKSGICLIPSFRVDPPARDDSDEFDYTYNPDSHRNRYSSVPSTSLDDLK